MRNQKPRKRDRVYALFESKKEAPPLSAPPLSGHTASGPSGVTESPDRRRTKARYVEAANLLKEAIRAQERWGKFEFPELKGELEEFNVSQFTDGINALLETSENKIKDKTAWDKCEHVMQCLFTACSPFAAKFLTIVKDSQSVLLGVFLLI
jgi:hypothetical protein